MRSSLLAGAFAVSVAGGTPAVGAQGAAPFPPSTEAYAPRYQLPNGPQTLVVFIGMTGCGASRDPELREAVRAMKPLLARQAKARGEALALIGVSLDWDPDSGFAYLRGLGRWDEAMTGGNWVGTGGVEYIWDQPEGRAATPQLLIFERTVEVADKGIRVGPKRERQRLLGTAAIIEWVRSGAALPPPAGGLPTTPPN